MTIEDESTPDKDIKRYRITAWSELMQVKETEIQRARRELR